MPAEAGTGCRVFPRANLLPLAGNKGAQKVELTFVAWNNQARHLGLLRNLVRTLTRKGVAVENVCPSSSARASRVDVMFHNPPELSGGLHALLPSQLVGSMGHA